METVTKYLTNPQHKTIIICTSVCLLSALIVGFNYKSFWKIVKFNKNFLRKRTKRKKNGSVNVGAIFGMDVGGTLAKIVYFQTDPNNEESVNMNRRPSTDSFAQLESTEHQAALQELYNFMDKSTSNNPHTQVTKDDQLSVHSNYLGGRLHFLHFETRNMIAAINYVSTSAFTENIKSIGCTGGGAHKYANDILEHLDITVNKYDELGCLVRGMLFALANFEEECYTFRTAEDETPSDIPNAVKRWQRDSKDYTKKVVLPYEAHSQLPYLVVNIGSGVSILKVSGPGKFERVSGTSLGGGTYWGLCRLLTKCQSYEEVLDLAEAGDAGKVDMLVKDIYGGDYLNLLTGSMVASSFGKLVMKENPRDGVSEEDLALALLMMITNNIGQVAYLNAKLHNCSKIFFVGTFLRHNPISCRRLAFAIDFWSAGQMEALFLMHEGYFGALGTFLSSAFGDEVDKMVQETENIAAIKRKRAQAHKSETDGSSNHEKTSETENKSATSLSDENNNSDSFSKALNQTFRKWSQSIRTSSNSPPPPEFRRGRSSSDDYILRNKSSL